MTRYRVIVVILFLLLAFLQIKLWVGPASYTSNKKLHVDLVAAQLKNQQLSSRNRHLYAEILSLKNGDAAIAAKARIDLGMVKKNEVFYQIIRSNNAHTTNQ